MSEPPLRRLDRGAVKLVQILVLRGPAEIWITLSPKAQRGIDVVAIVVLIKVSER